MRFLLICLTLWAVPASADTLRIAVAASALPLAQSVADDMPGTQLHLSAGSSGALLAQISHGAPFDLFLSADAERPAILAAQGRGVAQTYALGRLVLWSATENLVDGPDALTLEPMAIANPVLAPYGIAAQDVLAHFGATPRLVMGQNIGQAAGMVATGNARAGLIAAALVPDTGSRWDVPADLHRPIRHDLIVLHDSASAQDFIRLLGDPDRLRAHGFKPPDD